MVPRINLFASDPSAICGDVGKEDNIKIGCKQKLFKLQQQDNCQSPMLGWLRHCPSTGKARGQIPLYAVRSGCLLILQCRSHHDGKITHRHCKINSKTKSIAIQFEHIPLTSPSSTHLLHYKAQPISSNTNIYIYQRHIHTHILCGKP